MPGQRHRPLFQYLEAARRSLRVPVASLVYRVQGELTLCKRPFSKYKKKKKEAEERNKEEEEKRGGGERGIGYGRRYPGK